MIGWAIVQWLIVNWVARQEFFCWNRLIKILIAQYLKLRVVFVRNIYGFLPGTGFHYRIAIDYLAARLEGFQTSHWKMVRANENSVFENLP